MALMNNELDNKVSLYDGSPVPCVLLANKVRHVLIRIYVLNQRIFN